MIGIDTNVLARFFIGDDEAQSEAARIFLNARSADDPVFISILVVAELVWVLRNFYEVPTANVIEMIGVLTSSPAIVIERQDLVIAAMHLANHNKADIADAIIALTASDAGCSIVMTFDKAAAKRIPGMEVLT